MCDALSVELKIELLYKTTNRGVRVLYYGFIIGLSIRPGCELVVILCVRHVCEHCWLHVSFNVNFFTVFD